MLEFRSIYQLEPYYYHDFKKYIFRDDVWLHFNVSTPKIDIISHANIFAQNIFANNIKAMSIYGDHLNIRTSITNKLKCISLYSRDFIKSKEIIARNINAETIESDSITTSDMIAKRIKAKKIKFNYACIAVEKIICTDIYTPKKSGVCVCLGENNEKI